MKWCEFNREGEGKMRKLFGGKVMYYLFAVATLGLLLGASVKWHGGG